MSISCVGRCCCVEVVGYWKCVAMVKREWRVKNRNLCQRCSGQQKPEQKSYVDWARLDTGDHRASSSWQLTASNMTHPSPLPGHIWKGTLQPNAPQFLKQHRFVTVRSLCSFGFLVRPTCRRRWEWNIGGMMLTGSITNPGPMQLCHYKSRMNWPETEATPPRLEPSTFFQTVRTSQ